MKPHVPANFFEMVDMICDQLSPLIPMADDPQAGKEPRGYDTSRRIRLPSGRIRKPPKPKTEVMCSECSGPTGVFVKRFSNQVRKCAKCKSAERRAARKLKKHRRRIQRIDAVKQYEYALYRGRGHRTSFSKGVWYALVRVRKKGEPEFKPDRIALPDATDHASALEEARKLHIRLLQAGAVWWRKTSKVLPEWASKPRTLLDADQHIVAYHEVVHVRKYMVKVGKRILSRGFEHIAEARSYRDNYIRDGGTLKKCAICMRDPIWAAGQLVHDVEGCPNQVIFQCKGIDRFIVVTAWNLRFAKGKNLHWGVVTPQHLYELKVFGAIEKMMRGDRGGPKAKLKEERVFDFEA